MIRNTIKIDTKMKRTVRCSQCNSQNIQGLFESTEDWLIMRNRSTNEIVGVNSKMYQEAYEYLYCTNCLHNGPSKYFVKEERLTWMECKGCSKETVHTEGSWDIFSRQLSLECSGCRAFKTYKISGTNELEVISDTGKSFSEECQSGW